MQNQDRPIAFFDSGLGGISVLRETVRLLPEENYLYYGDSLHAPYGVKTVDEVIARSRAIVQHLLDEGAKAIVIACNTATAAAANTLRAEFPDVPIIGTEPALKPAVERHPGGRILVMATAMTVKEQKFQALRAQYEQHDAVISRRDGHERQIMTTEDIRLPGVHNVENYMAAIAAVDGLVPDDVIRTFARAFNGVEHRIELVRTWRGVRFYNDSIASSPSRTIAGLRSFKEKVILIAGGYDKHIPFDVLGPEVVEHVKLLILCGATADKIRAAVEQAPGYRPGHPEILDVTPFQKAVETARDRAVPGDVVTLSPACAAFDQFKNFMERGKTFKAIVNSWQE